MNQPLQSRARIFLSAGPRAGKTEQLLRWEASWSYPVHYLALWSDDTSLDVFLLRLLGSFPSIKARFDQLRSAHCSSSAGALLGQAIAEQEPELCLLIDDFHVVEGTSLEPELLALIRCFPPRGTLAIASRHRASVTLAAKLQIWDAEHPAWGEAPQAADVEALPPDVLARGLALCVVGELASISDGGELIRRNLARVDENSLLVLRPTWREAFETALRRRVAEPDWLLVERGLKEFYDRHLQTAREADITAMLDRVPPLVKERYPHLLVLSAKVLFPEGRSDEALEVLKRALAVCETPSDRLDVLIALAKGLSLVGDHDACGARLGELEPFLAAASPAQRAQVLNLKAIERWHQGEEVPVLEALWRQVLANPATDGRALQFEHYLAYSNLAIIYLNLENKEEAGRYSKLAMKSVIASEFEWCALSAHSLNLACELMTSHLSLDQVLSVPCRGLRFAKPLALLRYVNALADRVRQARAHAVARKYLLYVRSRALEFSQMSLVHSTNSKLLDLECHQGRLRDAERLYEEVLAKAATSDARASAVLTWATALHANGHADRARALLESGLVRQPKGPQRERMRLVLARLDGSATPEEQDLLTSLTRSNIWLGEPYWQKAMGLSEMPDTFSVYGFGPLRLTKNDAEELQVSRRKAFSMLGYLLLNQEGMPGDVLAEYLFGDPSALKSLHTITYSLRQGLKKLGADHLLEVNGNWYRLAQKAIAYSDVVEFDGLFHKARELEAEGALNRAAMFYELALLHVSGPLFEDIPTELESARDAYQGKVRRAQSFLQQHAAGLEA